MTPAYESRQASPPWRPPALKGRNLNSLALERQVTRSPKSPIRPEGAGHSLPIMDVPWRLFLVQLTARYAEP